LKRVSKRLPAVLLSTLCVQSLLFLRPMCNVLLKAREADLQSWRIVPHASFGLTAPRSPTLLQTTTKITTNRRCCFGQETDFRAPAVDRAFLPPQKWRPPSCSGYLQKSFLRHQPSSVFPTSFRLLSRVRVPDTTACTACFRGRENCGLH
jgi:hypothetical protein